MCVRNQFGQVFKLYGDPERDRGQSHSTQSYNGLSGSTSRKGMQQLTGRLAALGRFIYHFIDQLKPFFITLRGAKRACWNKECEQAFTMIKQYLTKLLILASPRVGDILYLYLAVSKASISVTLLKEDKNRK